MLEDAGASVVLTGERLVWEEIARESAEPLAPAAGPESLAYVIYTSGSTGRPKGVEISRRSLANFVRAMRRLYAVGPGDAMPGITTTAFDLSVPELYLPMLGGGATPLLSRETAGDGVLLARALDACRATVLQGTPATWRLLLESGWTGRPGMLLLTGAEALSRDLADRLLPLGRELWNFYGPTETTVWSTAWRVAPAGAISLGRPIAETRICLLDRAFVPVPLGAAGVLPGEGEADLRYRGQSFELTLPLQDDLAAAFHRAHEEQYGFADREREIELVSVRTAEVRPAPEVVLPRYEPRTAAGAARVELDGSTLWVPPGWVGVRDGATWIVTRT